ncbi:MAG: hypothetical protein ASUL_00520 [Candidatus Aramenus sulfurataquae]|jgi:hypothetical protein|uniref:Uncharacterized protein n=2 Tax=Candidatus Aramenus sulfurataquae TaxID=1326980 RepID=W7KZ67_9CREN|nr:MAG: hypothetical protein ASUL_00520 [Candidatus Aramenus sulfurataquae]MCL7343065.1 hypothetical protein [Candidatus Aramenus sulfurataquae]
MQELEKGSILTSLTSAVPMVGGPITGFLLGRKLRDFEESLPYLFISLPLFVISSSLVSFFFIRSYLYLVLIYSAISPVLVNYLTSRKYENMTINVNEYYIEIKFDLPMDMENFSDPNEVFEKLLHKALKKMRNPYYYYKLKSSGSCSSLKISLSEDKMVLRKRCGDLIIEIEINNKKIANMKVTISY